MPWDRLPRKFLSSWCYQARPVGRPVYRWGEGAEGAIKAVELKVKDWAAFAAERVDWRALVHGYDDPDVTPGSIKSSSSSSSSSNKRTALTRVRVTVTALLDWRVAPSYLESGVELSGHSREIQRLYAIWEAHKESEEAAAAIAAAAIAAAAITAAAATAAATTPAPEPEPEPEPELEPAPTARVPLTAAQKAACFATLAQTITTTKAETAARAAAPARASAASAAWELWCARNRDSSEAGVSTTPPRVAQS